MLDEVFCESHVDGHYTRKIQKENKNLYTAGDAEVDEARRTRRIRRKNILIRHPRENGDPVTAGIVWIPAFAGMTYKGGKSIFQRSVKVFLVMILCAHCGERS